MDDGRFFFMVFVKKKNVKKIVFLLSYFDVVDIEDYGEFKYMVCKFVEFLSFFLEKKELFLEYV